jgi:hypothetical protein
LETRGGGELKEVVKARIQRDTTEGKPERSANKDFEKHRDLKRLDESEGIKKALRRRKSVHLIKGNVSLTFELHKVSSSLGTNRRPRKIRLRASGKSAFWRAPKPSLGGVGVSGFFT